MVWVELVIAPNCTERFSARILERRRTLECNQKSNYAEHSPERRRMIQAWADHLDVLREAGAHSKAAT
jgi:hypothetical protein